MLACFVGTNLLFCKAISESAPHPAVMWVWSWDINQTWKGYDITYAGNTLVRPWIKISKKTTLLIAVCQLHLLLSLWWNISLSENVLTDEVFSWLVKSAVTPLVKDFHLQVWRAAPTLPDSHSTTKPHWNWLNQSTFSHTVMPAYRLQCFTIL